MSNPVLNEKFLGREGVIDSAPMTINGAISKTLILFVCLLISAVYTFSLVASGFADKAQMLTIGGAIGGFILALIIIFSKNLTVYKYLTPVYAVAEGFFVGGLSGFFESAFAGIVFQAVTATFVTLFMVLGAYRAGIIRATEKFRSVVILSTMSIAAIYVIQIVASFFGRSIPEIFTASTLGIVFSVIAVILASLNLILDFDFIERGAQAMLEKEYEWYGAFGLIVTLVWLYVEILRLLIKFYSRN